MRRKLFGSMLAVSAVALFVPALADEMGSGPTITVHGELRARWEYLDNYTDFNGDSSSDDTFDFTPYRARVGVDADFGSKVAGHIEIQNVGAFGNTLVPSLSDPALQSLNGFNFGNETSLYQANIDIKEVFSPNFSLRIGRQEHTEGNELQMGDADFYNGLAFDGIRGMYDAEKWNMDVFWYTIQERNVLPGAATVPGPLPVNGASNDVTFSGVTMDFDIMDNGQKIEPYILLFHDAAQASAASFWTLGALYHRPAAQDRAMDWSVEFAIQSGDVGSGLAEQDVKGSILEGWFGYSWGDTSRHRVHIGALVVSDGDSTTEVESYIPLFPDTHAMNRLGDMDYFTAGPNTGAANNSACGGGFGNGFHNVTNFNAGYDWTSGSHHFAGSLHQFTASEDFGGACDGDYGQEVDLSYDYAVTHNLSFQAGIATFMPGDEFVSPNDDSAMRGWAQARLRF